MLLAAALGVAGLGIAGRAWYRAHALPRWELIEASVAAEDWRQARSYLSAWLERSPNNPDLLLRMAFVEQRLGDLPGCLASLRRVPDASPQKLEALFREGWVLQKELYGAQSERAFQEYLRAAAGKPSQEPRRFEATEALVTLYKLEGRYREARDILWSLHDGVSDAAMKLRVLSMATKLEFQRVVPDVVIPTLEKFIAADVEDYHARRALGAALVLRGDEAKGRAILQGCAAERPDDLDVWDLWIDVLLRSGDLAAAERTVPQLPRAADRHAALWAHRGAIGAARGDLTRAIEAYGRAIELEPFRREWQYQISRVLRDAGQNERAEQYAKQARERSERYGEMNDAFGKLSDTIPVRDTAEIRKLADWCQYIGWQREALGWYEQLMRREPHDEAAQAVLARLRETVRPRTSAESDTLAELASASEKRPHTRVPRDAGLAAKPAVAAVVPQFVDVARESGIEFEYFQGAQGRFLPMEINGGGIALFDYDGDGYQDLYLVNGNLSGTDTVDRSQLSRLYRNRGDGRFDDVTELCGAGHAGYGHGCAAADYDNDGFADLYVTCYGTNALYHNNGDGTFSDASASSGCDCNRFSSSCAFGDLDRDGNLDLYVVTYVEFDPARFRPCTDPESRRDSYCPPQHFSAQHDVLFRNDGDGAFSDVSEAAGILRPNGKGLGIVLANLDDDGWPDVFVANDGEPNFLFRNRSAAASSGPIRLQDEALEDGAALSDQGLAQACMGIACGDWDQDGRLDLLVSNFFMEACTLYRNRGSQGFEDATATARLRVPTTHTMGWGTEFIDYDNDGWLDLFVTNGHVIESQPVYRMPAQFFRNTGGRFEEVTSQAGSYFADRWVGRGAAFGDYDNDGRVDIVVSHLQRPVALLRNQTITNNHFVRLELAGRQSNRSAVNARVRVTTSNDRSHGNDLSLVREVVGGGSYLSSSDRRLLVGVGRADRVAIEVRWPSGDVDCWADLPVDEWWYLVEGLPPRVRRSLSAR